MHPQARPPASYTLLALLLTSAACKNEWKLNLVDAEVDAVDSAADAGELSVVHQPAELADAGVGSDGGPQVGEAEPCSTVACGTGATCVSRDGRAGCECEVGFAPVDGSTSECAYVGCAPEVCANGSRCTEKDGRAECECLPGYIGNRCETDACDPNPCNNAGVCSPAASALGGFSCDCAQGYSGAACSADVCELQPCLNGASCARLEAGRRCDCVGAWTGDDCGINDEATLASMSVSTGHLLPAFSPNITDYVVVMGIHGPEVELSFNAQASSGVQLQVNGSSVAGTSASITRQVGVAEQQDLSIQVTAASGRSLEYSVSIRRGVTQQAVLGGPNTGLGGSRLGTLVGGGSLALDGDLLAIGAHEDNTAYLFSRTAGRWAEVLEFHPLNYYPEFGTKVALGADNLYVSAPGDETDLGSVSWISRDRRGRVSASGRIRAPAAEAGPGFGQSVAADGRTVAIGQFSSSSPETNKVYIYEFDGTEHSAPTVLTQPTGAEGYYGAVLALEENTLAVRATGTETHLYERTVDGWNRVDPLTSPMAKEHSWGLAIDGSRVLMSEFENPLGTCQNNASVLLASRGESRWTWTAAIPPPAFGEPFVPECFGAGSLVLKGNALVVAAPYEHALAQGVSPLPVGSPAVGGRGAAYLFNQIGESWSVSAYLKPAAPDTPDGFGQHMAVSGDTLAIGSPDSDKTYIFHTDCTLAPEGQTIPGCAPAEP